MERTKETYQNLKAVFKRLEELGKIAGKKYCFIVDGTKTFLPWNSGLPNLNNNCFINASLQALFCLEPVQNIFEMIGSKYLRFTKNEEEFEPLYILLAYGGILFQGKCDQSSLKQLAETLLDHLSTRKVINIENWLRGYTLGGQHDTHEFIMGLNDYVNKSYSVLESLKMKSDNIHFTSILSDVFKIEGVEITSCGQHYKDNGKCVHEILTLYPEAPFIDMIKSYFNYRVEDSWCTDCYKSKGEKTCVYKQFSMDSSPTVLGLVISRNQYGWKNQKFTEIEETFDLYEIIQGQFMPKQKKKAIYKLSSMILHCGGFVNLGHYVTISKNSFNQTWYKFDDQFVTALTDFEVQNMLLDKSKLADQGTPVMLFFKKTEETTISYLESSKSSKTESSLASLNTAGKFLDRERLQESLSSIEILQSDEEIIKDDVDQVEKLMSRSLSITASMDKMISELMYENQLQKAMSCNEEFVFIPETQEDIEMYEDDLDNNYGPNRDQLRKKRGLPNSMSYIEGIAEIIPETQYSIDDYESEIITDNRISIARNIPNSMSYIDGISPIMAELQKEKEISENCFVKERDDFDENKITKNKKKDKKKANQTRNNQILPNSMSFIEGITPIMAELQKEKEISENCFVKERDDFDQNKITKNKKKDKKKANQTRNNQILPNSMSYIEGIADIIPETQYSIDDCESEIKTDNRISIARNIPESMSFIEGISPIMAELQKEKEISENCFVKERDDSDQNKITKNKKKDKKKANQTRNNQILPNSMSYIEGIADFIPETQYSIDDCESGIITDNRISIARNIPESMSYIEGISPIMSELQKEKEISQNFLVKEQENFDKNTKIKNRNTDKKKEDQTRNNQILPNMLSYIEGIADIIPDTQYSNENYESGNDIPDAQEIFRDDGKNVIITDDQIRNDRNHLRLKSFKEEILHLSKESSKEKKISKHYIVEIEKNFELNNQIFNKTKYTAPGTKSKIEVLYRVDDSSDYRKTNEKAAENLDFASSDSFKTSSSSTSSSSNSGRSFRSKKSWTNKKEYDKEYQRNRRSSLSTEEKEAEKLKNNIQHYQRYHRMVDEEKSNLLNINKEYKIDYRSKKRNKEPSYEDIVDDYEEAIVDRPNIICFCCGQLCWKSSVKKYSNTILERRLDSNQSLKDMVIEPILWEKLKNTEKYLCHTCCRYISANKVPRLALYGNMNFPIVNEIISELNDAELMLIQPRIAFMKIRPIAPKYGDFQLGMIGNVVNVPSDQNRFINILPRSFEEHESIEVHVKRRMEDDRSYTTANVRPQKVIQSLEHLVRMPLFRQFNIEIEKDLFETLTRIEDQELLHYMENLDQSKKLDQSERNKKNNNKKASDYETDDDGKKFAAFNSNFESQDTLICNFNISVAPCEDTKPTSVYRDPFAEQLIFLKIYGGENPCQYLDQNKKISYQQVCKSEFRRFDRRCALDITKIFFSYKKLVAEKLRAAIEICLRKNTLSEELRVKEALDKDIIEKFIVSSEGLIMLRSIRSSPQFWHLKKMEVFEMIRQRGPQDLFLTFSPSESDWLECVATVMEALTGVYPDLETVRKINPIERKKILASDPVTVARYFDKRMIELIKIVKKSMFPYELEDYFWRVEFQHRGSGHVHFLGWIKGGPKLPEVTPTNDDEKRKYNQILDDCINFIDHLITAERPEYDLLVDDIYKKEIKSVDIVKFQTHKCWENCKTQNSNGDAICKYGFPWPILKNTHILDPLDPLKEDLTNRDVERHKMNYILIRNKLEELCKTIAAKEEPDIKSEIDIQRKLNLTQEQYILALRSSISRRTVFLKRDVRSIRINPYNKKMILRHRANMDIQYVVDPKQAALYVVAYMIKSNAIMSKTLQNLSDELKKGNKSLKERMLAICNRFQNATEVGAQEAVFTLLSLPVSHCTRTFVYINTYPPNKRHVLVKGKKHLEKMNPNSTNIYYEGLLGHYENRSNELENMCLAYYASHFEYISDEQYKKRNDKNEKICNGIFEEEEEDNADEDLNIEKLEDDQESESDQEKNLHNKIRKGYYKQKQDGYVKELKKSKLIRCKRYNKNNDPCNWYRTECMLYLPWRNEKAEITNNADLKSIQKFYTDNQQEIENNRLEFEYPDADVLEDAIFNIEKIVESHNNDATSAVLEMENAHRKINNENDQNKNVDNMTLSDMAGYSSDSIEALEDKYGFIIDEQSTRAEAVQTNIEKTEFQFPDALPREELMAQIQCLNEKQSLFFINIIKHIYNEENFLIFLCGSGGTGKSVCIRSIYQTNIVMFNLVDQNPRELVTLLSAFTGVAAYNIDSQTLHTLFGITIDKYGSMPPLNETEVAKYYNKFKNVKVLIIDEVSMIGKKLWIKVDIRLRQILDANKPFGGLSVLAVGDFKQIPPVMEPSIFGDGSGKGQALPEKGNHLNKLVQALTDNKEPWFDFKMWELTEVMRQREDLIYIEILEKIGNCGFNSCTKEDIKILENRIVRFENIPDDTIILSFSNNNVRRYNQERIIARDGELHECICQNICTGVRSEELAAKQKLNKWNDPNENELFERQNTYGSVLSYKIRFKLGCKYMITRNINTGDGLVNGTVGVLKHIVLEKDLKKSKHAGDKDPNDSSNVRLSVARIWILFDKEKTGRIQRDAPQNRELRLTDDIAILNPYEETSLWVPFSYIQETIDKNTANGMFWNIIRTQYHFVESEAMTVHKSQSQTYDKVAVDLNGASNGSYFQNLKNSILYTALSRCRSLDGLYLFNEKHKSGKLTLSTVKKGELEDKAIQKEMKRLRLPQNSLVNAFLFAEEKYSTPDCLNVMHLHVAGIGDNYEKLKEISNDVGFRHADIIFLVGCRHTKALRNSNFTDPVYRNCDNQDYYLIQDPDLRFLTAGPDIKHHKLEKNKFGMICLVKKNRLRKGKFRFIAATGTGGIQDNDSNFEASIIEYTEAKKEKPDKIGIVHLFCIVYFKQNQKGKQTQISAMGLFNFITKSMSNLKYKGDPKGHLFIFGYFGTEFNGPDIITNLHEYESKICKLLGKKDNKKAEATLYNAKTYRNINGRSVPNQRLDQEAGKIEINFRQHDYMFTNKPKRVKTTTYPVWYSHHAAMHHKIQFE